MITQKRIKELFDYRNDGTLLYRQGHPSRKCKAGEIAGCLSKQGYIDIGVDGKNYRAHRLIYLWHYGYTPEVTDHINRIKNDNRIENLRESNFSENGHNCSKVSNKTGYRGVVLDARRKFYQAVISIKKKRYYLGSYKTAEEAGIAYKQAKEELLPGVLKL